MLNFFLYEKRYKNNTNNFYLSSRFFSVSFNLYKQNTNCVENSRLKTLKFSLNNNKIFLKKKMEFKVNKHNNFFLKKTNNLDFFKPHKQITFFGLKYSKKQAANYFTKTQTKLQELNFVTKNLFSINRDLGLNPYFGGISRGFSKLLVKVQLKEYLNGIDWQNFKILNEVL